MSIPSFSEVKSKKKKKRKKERKKRKEEKKKVLTSFQNFSCFHFKFFTFSPSLYNFPSFLLNFYPFTLFPFFPCLFFPDRSTKISRSEVSGGALCPPAPLPACYATALYPKPNVGDTVDEDTNTFLLVSRQIKVDMACGNPCNTVACSFMITFEMP